MTIDSVTGDFHVYTCYDVVEEVNNEKTEISLADAQKQNPSYEVGDVVTEEVTRGILDGLQRRPQNRWWCSGFGKQNAA